MVTFKKYKSCTNVGQLQLSKTKIIDPTIYYSKFKNNGTNNRSRYTIFTGTFLPDLCKTQRTMPRRVMSQLLSSGAAAFSPISAIASYPASAEATDDSSELRTSFAWAPFLAPTSY